MKLGTKSILFGAHQFLIHPLFVLVAWVKLYGWPKWRMLIAIFIHDWGYWGSPNMDGPEGERHPVWAAEWCARRMWMEEGFECLKHSRFVCKNLGSIGGHLVGDLIYPEIVIDQRPSRLCWADKLGSALMPVWLWCLLTRMTGEIKEYMDQKKYEINLGIDLSADTPEEFFKRYKKIAVQWAQDQAHQQEG